MEYLVSIENTPYMRWQAALLHESLQIQGLGDKLVIACAQTTNGKTLPYERVYYHENVGSDYGYKCLNRAAGLLGAVQQGIISQPFASIDPDTFMLRPLREQPARMVLQKVWYMQPDMMKKVWNMDVEEVFGVPESKWPGTGCSYVFNDVPLKLFEAFYYWTVKMCEDYEAGDNKLPQTTTAYWQRDMYAYNAAIGLSDISYEMTTALETHLDFKLEGYNPNAYFVHYCNGYTPHFDKRHHNAWNQEFSIGSPLPFDAILKMPLYTKEGKMFKAIVNNYLSRKPDMDQFLS